MKKITLLLFTISFLSACSLITGSEAWCQKMKETPKAEWSASDAANFAKHCILK